ncbi:MAG: selenide, water dikinase SelD [Acidobacteria bacterium]|nr:selenide, water dikinase SelD [Acidobacteriota bacterium]
MRAAPTPILKDLVLVGGGHSHVFVLKGFGMSPMPGVRLTLIGRDVHTPYSGMLPGLIAGHYTYDEAHIDLQKLARFAGARFLHDEVVGLDAEACKLHFRSRPPVGYDVLSIDIGSTPAKNNVPGADRFATAVKPIGKLVAKWDEVVARVLDAKGKARIGVVGAGAAGTEMTLAMQYRLRNLLREAGLTADPEFHLFSSSADVLPTHNAGVRKRFRRILAERGVHVHLDSRVSEVLSHGVKDQAGHEYPLDEILWTTQAGAQPWPAAAGLAVTPGGFIKVGDTLESISHPYVFAAGDVAEMVNHPREKAGVFAVRQGPPLEENLRRALLGRTGRRFRPQKQFLSLVSTGDAYAVASRWFLSAEGEWVWKWKDHIDRKFMRKFSEDLPMQSMAEMSSPGPLLTDDEARATLAAAKMRCAGCGGKIGAGPLERALAKIKPLEREGVVVGLRGADDAAVISVPFGKVAVQSVDFFRAFCDDPYLFGRITANHALGDIFAKGAEAHSALAIAVAPYARESKVEEALYHMLYGANEALREAGAALVGGHSTEGVDLSLGLSVTGIADPDRLMRKGGARPGDALVLTKPIGVGALFAADMMGQAKGRWIANAMESMCRSNAAAAQVFLTHGATACTDVTGFGLAGHLAEMLAASGAAAELELRAIPLLDGAAEVTLAGHRSSLYPQNVRIERVIQGAPLDGPIYPLLFDPQTAGGLLAAVPPQALDETLTALERAGCAPAVIGRATPAKGGKAQIRLQS